MNVSGLTVVVTGVIEGESRLTAEKRLRDLGAQTTKTVTSKVDLLITGAKVGPAKMKKAEALGVRVVSWAEAVEGAAATAPAALPETFLARQVNPMLAQLAEAPPTGAGYIHEIKWDGVRCVATVKDGRVSMKSRSDLSDYCERFPKVCAELATLPDCVIDGELVNLAKAGGSFQALSRTESGGSFVVFDILEEGADDLRALPLETRRERLEALLANVGTSVTTSPRFDDGPALLAYVAEQGMEGVVSKRLASRYQEGARNSDWQKIKVRLSQEFIVIGWKEGEGSRAGRIGSILLGVHEDDGSLTFVGRCGTGQTSIAGWDALRAALSPLPAQPDLDVTVSTPRELRGVQWVEPTVVVQVEFQRWTEDGRLWHPSYLGMRDDKLASEVGRSA